MSTHFVLPGRTINPLAFTKLQIAKAYALSRSCNPRNIEFRSYGLWSQCLTDLTSDSRFLIVIPQHLLYYVPTENSEDSASISEVEDSSIDDLANATFSTIDSIPSTRPESSAVEILPDFAIIRVKCRFRNYVLRPTYLNLKIRYAGVPILAEVKRAGSRSLHGVEFLRSTEVEIERAANDLFRQAAYLFTMHERQHYVVLMACSGVYWACMFADRNTVMDRVVGKPVDDFQPELDNSNDLGQVSSDDEDDMGEDLGDVLLEEDIDELDIMDQPDDPTANMVNANDEKSDAHSSSSVSEEDYLEPVVPDADLAVPENRWTKLLRLDSRASNQHMLLIHSRLGDVVGDNTGRMG